MKLRSPIVAMLWELWRLTRAEIAWKLALPIAIAVAALLLGAAFGPPRYQDAANINDAIAAFALIIIVVPQLVPWMSIAKLNGSQPGFPFYLAYTRPVRTSVIVGLPMAYLTAVSTAIYLVPAIVLRVTSGYAFPLLPVAAWLAALSWVGMAAFWSTRNKVFQVCVTMFALVKILVTAMDRLTAVEIRDNFDWPPRLWPALFDFPRTDYAWIALIGLASFGVTVAMVARQRRGDELAAITWTPGGGLWGRLVGLFGVPCPTSSATRAQLWFDLKSRGVPVLTIGVVLASVTVLVSAVSGPIDAAWNADPTVSCPIKECFWVRAMPPMLTPFMLVTILLLGVNAFGIRRKQGRTYVSAFEATNAYGTAQVAVLKILAQSVCVLAAFIAIGVGVWISMPLLGDGVFIQMFGVPLNSRRSVLTKAFAALAGYEQLALTMVAVGSVVMAVAAFAMLGALRLRYSRLASLASFLLVPYSLLFVWLWVGVRGDPAAFSWLHLDVVYGAMSWSATTVMAITTVYVVWTGFAEHVLTLRYAGGAVAISLAFAAAWLTLVHMIGVPLTGVSTTNAISIASLALLPLTVSMLAPWSYGRIRHT